MMANETRRHAVKNGPFLLELILVILFLAIAGAICMRVFASSYLLSQRGSDLSNATNHTRNVIEQFKASESAEAFLASLALPGDSTAILQYDKNWKPAAADGVFRMEVTLAGEELVTATVTARRAGTPEPILTVTAKKYFPK